MKPSETWGLVKDQKPFPFVGIFGCVELEQVAENVTKYVSENGDDWEVLVPLHQICTKWDLDHGHPYSGSCKFVPDFAGEVRDDLYRVTELFIDRVKEASRNGK